MGSHSDQAETASGVWEGADQGGSSGRGFSGVRHAQFGATSAAVHSLSAMNDQLALENCQLLQQLAEQQSIVAMSRALPCALHGEPGCTSGEGNRRNLNCSPTPVQSPAQPAEGLSLRAESTMHSGGHSTESSVSVGWEGMPAVLGYGTWQNLLEGMLRVLRTVHEQSVHASHALCPVSENIATSNWPPAAIQRTNTAARVGLLQPTDNPREPLCIKADMLSTARAEGADAGRVMIAIAKAALCLQTYCQTLQAQLVNSIAAGTVEVPALCKQGFEQTTIIPCAGMGAPYTATINLIPS